MCTHFLCNFQLVWPSPHKANTCSAVKMMANLSHLSGFSTVCVCVWWGRYVYIFWGCICTYAWVCLETQLWRGMLKATWYQLGIMMRVSYISGPITSHWQLYNSCQLINTGTTTTYIRTLYGGHKTATRAVAQKKACVCMWKSEKEQEEQGNGECEWKGEWAR